MSHESGLRPPQVSVDFITNIHTIHKPLHTVRDSGIVGLLSISSLSLLGLVLLHRDLQLIKLIKIVNNRLKMIKVRASENEYSYTNYLIWYQSHDMIPIIWYDMKPPPPHSSPCLNSWSVSVWWLTREECVGYDPGVAWSSSHGRSTLLHIPSTRATHTRYAAILAAMPCHAPNTRWHGGNILTMAYRLPCC